YVPNAIPTTGESGNAAMTMMPAAGERAGTQNLNPLGVAGLSTQLRLGVPGSKDQGDPTSVSLSDQGLVQVLEAAVSGLDPGKPYVLALSSKPDGGGALQPLQGFMTNPAGAAVVNTIGPIRQLVRGEAENPRRYLVIVPGTATQYGAPVQVQTECAPPGLNIPGRLSLLLPRPPGPPKLHEVPRDSSLFTWRPGGASPKGEIPMLKTVAVSSFLPGLRKSVRRQK